MNEKVNSTNETKKRGFPWRALAIFAFVYAAYGFNEFLMLSAGLFDSDTIGTLIIGGIAGIIAAVFVANVVVAIQYAVTKFPAQWISKEKNVYKNDIWQGLLYSGAIGIVMNFILETLNYHENVLLRTAVNVITTVLFLLFYISGEDKESHVVKAVTIVQVVLLVLGILLSVLVGDVAVDILL